MCGQCERGWYHQFSGCDECPAAWWLPLGVSLLLFLGLAVLIRRGTVGERTLAVIQQVANYLQLLGAELALRVDWPDFVLRVTSGMVRSSSPPTMP